jgi:pimeloyl-ACP methyl ester carboxylesterase
VKGLGMDFESSLKDSTATIAIDFSAHRSILLLAFGGFANQLGIPAFEFNRITGSFEQINRIFLRDKHQMWYHSGLPGVGNDIDGIANFLRQYRSHPSTRLTIVLGNSGGGYAALLFGHLLQVDQVHAFAPKTFIHPLQRLIQHDTPHAHPEKLLRLLLRGQRKYFDLKRVFLAAPNPKTRYHIYYSAADRIDKLHAARLQSISGIDLHDYPHGQHDLIKTLKQSGQLSEIIAQAIRLTD